MAYVTSFENSATLNLNPSSVLNFSDGNKSGSTYGSDLVLSDSIAEWNTFESNYGEVSLLNALNQASAAGSGNTLDAAYDQGGAGAGRSITADSGAVAITVPDASNNVAFTINQNDVTNNTLAYTIDGTFADLTSGKYLGTQTLTVAPTANNANFYSGPGVFVFNNTAFDFTAALGGLGGTGVSVEHDGSGTVTSMMGVTTVLSNKAGNTSMGSAYFAVFQNTGGGTTSDVVFYDGWVVKAAGTISNASALYLRNHSGAPTNTYFLKLDATSDWKSGENLEVLDDATSKYIPFSTATTGITRDSSNLVFATTTSGDIQLNPFGKVFIDQNNNSLSLDIDSEATTSNIIEVQAETITTGNALSITNANALTTGSAAQFRSNSAVASARNVVHISNDNAASTGAVALRVDQAGVDSAILVDHNNTGNAIDVDLDFTSTVALGSALNLSAVNGNTAYPNIALALTTSAGALSFNETITAVPFFGVYPHLQQTLTISPSGNSSAVHIGQNVQVDHDSAFDLSGSPGALIAGNFGSINSGSGDITSSGFGFAGSFSQEGVGTTALAGGVAANVISEAGTITDATGFVSSVEANGTSTITSGSGLLLYHNKAAGATFTSYSGIYLQNTDTGTADNFYFIKLDNGSEWKNGENLVVLDDATSKYLPFSTANTGLTRDSANLVFATTTSGNIILSPADDGFIDVNTSVSDAGADFIGVDVKLNRTDSIITSYRSRAFEAFVTKTDNNNIIGDDSLGAVIGKSVHNGTGTIGFAEGGFFTVESNSTGTITDAVGIVGSIDNNGNGTFTTAIGGFVGAFNYLNGTITDGIGLQVGHSNDAAGTFTNFSGFHLQNADVAPATNVYFLKLDASSDFLSAGGNLVVDNNGTPNYIPLVTSDVSGFATTALDNLASVDINAALNVTSGNLTLQTTTSGNIVLSPADDGFIDVNLSVSDMAAEWTGIDVSTTVTTTGNNANDLRFIKNNTTYSSNNNLTGVLLGVSRIFNHAGTGTVSLNGCYFSETQVTNNGTMTTDMGFIHNPNPDVGAIITNSASFVCIDGGAGGTVTNKYAFNFDDGFISNSRSVKVVKNILSSPTSMFLPLSTADTGITFDSTDLVLATTTSGDIKLNPAINNGVEINQGIATSGTPDPALTILCAAHTGLTASTEASDVIFGTERTVQFATGNFNSQAAIRVQAPTYAFVGASTITSATSFQIEAPPEQGSNATLGLSSNLLLGEISGNTVSSSDASSQLIIMTGINDGVGNAGSRRGIIVSGPDGAPLSLGNTSSTLDLFAGLSVDSISLSSDTNTRTITDSASLFIGGAPTNAGNVTFTNGPYALYVASGNSRFSGLILGDSGAGLTAANDMAAPAYNYEEVNGATQINTMGATGITTGTFITLKFNSNPVVKHATAGTGAQFQLASSNDFSASAGATLMIVFDGTYWREVSRTVM